MRHALALAAFALLPACLFDYVEVSAGAAQNQGDVLRGANGTTPIAGSEGTSVFGWLTGGIFLDEGGPSWREREARELEVDQALEQRDVRELVRSEVSILFSGASDRLEPEAEVYGPEPMPDWGAAVLAELEQRELEAAEREEELEELRRLEGEVDWTALLVAGVTGALTLIAGVKGGPPAAAAVRASSGWVVDRVRRHPDDHREG